MKTFVSILVVSLALYYALKQLPLNHPIRRGIDETTNWIRSRIARLFGYRPSLYQPNVMSSNWLLGLFLNRNPWPVEVYVNFNGIYIIKRSWHGLTVRRLFYPMNMVQFISITEVLGHFAKIKVVVRMANNIVPIQIDRYFRFDHAEHFFQEWQAHAQLN